MADTIKVTQQVCRMVREGRARSMPAAVNAPWDAAACFNHIRDLPHEEVWLVGLNAANQPIGCAMVARGGMHGCALKPCDVLRPALVMGASAFILCHNHPSKDPTPSADDYQMTRALKSAAETVGCQMLDHIVVSVNGWRSIEDSTAQAT